MNKPKNIDKKVAVSRSAATICSAYGHRENAERKTPEQIAVEIQSYFAVGGTPQQFERDTEFVTAKIREAVNAEREACLQIAKDYNELASREFMSIYHAETVSGAISLNRK